MASPLVEAANYTAVAGMRLSENGVGALCRSANTPR